MAVTVTKIRVASLDLDHLDLFWEIGNVAAPAQDGDRHEILDYDFYVLRAGDSSSGEYKTIAGPLRDQYSLRDIQVSLVNKYRQYFYKIRVQNRVSGDFVDYGPAGSDSPEPDRIAAAIIYEEDILFREFIGRRCWLFPKRTFGPLCTCFRPDMGRRTRSGHLPCFDTGFLGGYMNPVECFVQIDPSSKMKQQTSLQEVQQNDAPARMLAFPQVNPGDILVENENRRWRVLRITPTTRLRSVVHQELLLHEIPRGDVEYNLPVNVNVATVQPASEKNFNNPYSIQDDGDLSDIFSAFGVGSPRGSTR